jgi:hypothetical protein
MIFCFYLKPSGSKFFSYRARGVSAAIFWNFCLRVNAFRFSPATPHPSLWADSQLQPKVDPLVIPLFVLIRLFADSILVHTTGQSFMELSGSIQVRHRLFLEGTEGWTSDIGHVSPGIERPGEAGVSCPLRSIMARITSPSIVLRVLLSSIVTILDHSASVNTWWTNSSGT